MYNIGHTVSDIEELPGIDGPLEDGESQEEIPEGVRSIYYTLRRGVVYGNNEYAVRGFSIVSDDEVEPRVLAYASILDLREIEPYNVVEMDQLFESDNDRWDTLRVEWATRATRRRGMYVARKLYMIDKMSVASHMMKEAQQALDDSRSI